VKKKLPLFLESRIVMYVSTEEKQPQQLKLNTKRTFLIGFAFFGILALWQVYAHYVQLFLDEMIPEQTWKPTFIGIIMALDKVLAVGLIPLFGLMSDKTKSRFGRRMPYIIAGTVAAVILFPLLAAMFLLNSLVGLIIVIVLLSVAMHFYRSPSVALMPDVTPKPKRAAANGIINFMGFVGAIIASVITMFFLLSEPETPGMLPHITTNQTLVLIPFLLISAILIVSLVLLIARFNEPKVLTAMKSDMELGEKLSETIEPVVEDKKLGKADRKNFIILFGCICLWFFAFNAIHSFSALYARYVLNTEQIGLTIAAMGVAGLVTFIPAIKLSTKVGRKNSILIGLGMMIFSLGLATFVRDIFLLTALLAISGSGWAIMNLNSYVMLVEMAGAKNVGKITGYYYIAQQGSQAFTAILAGFMFSLVSTTFVYEALFPYATIFMALAFILLLFFRTKKVKKDKTLNQVQPVATE
jgi:Na+/melibiose symporter-like transporter